MHTLREVVDFTGVAGPAGQLTGDHRAASLRNCGELVRAVVPADQRSSLRALCAALPTLPPIALAAQITDHGDVVGPSRPIIGVDVSPGAVVETVVNFFSGGMVQRPDSTARQLIDGQEIDGTTFAAAVFTEAKSYEAVVSRVGVTGGGVVRLERRLPFRVRAVPAPPPPPPPPVPTPTPAPAPGPQAGPTCEVEIVSRAGATTNVRVFGGGFRGGDTLVVLEDGGFGRATVADGLGSYSEVIGVLASTPPVDHLFQAASQTSTATSNVVSFSV